MSRRTRPAGVGRCARCDRVVGAHELSELLVCRRCRREARREARRAERAGEDAPGG